MLSDASGNEYDYPDVAEVTSQAKSSFLLPHNQAPSVRIPLSTFEVGVRACVWLGGGEGAFMYVCGSLVYV